MMKNVFYYMLKVLFVLEIFAFLSWHFGYVEKQLDRKAMVNFKIYDFTDSTTNNYLHTLPNISRVKGNQVMKFGQLRTYSVRNVFV